MKLQVRFMLLLSVVFVAIGAMLTLQRSFDIERSDHVLANVQKERKQSFNTNITAEGQTFQTFSEDYSFWDDMVNFVKTGNVAFAETNLDSGLSTFGADVDWVYRPDGTLLYTSKANPAVGVNKLTLPDQFFQTVAKQKFAHFYMQLPAGTLEIRAATIVPGNDPDHTSTPSGYWIIGRFLDDSYTSRLQTLSQSSVKLLDANASTAESHGGNSVSFTVPLKGFDGQPVRYLRSTSQVALIDDLHNLYQRELVSLFIIAALVLGLIFVTVWWLVLLPLRAISLAIQRKEPSLLNRLAHSGTQFGDLAKVVQQFFSQKLTIEQDQFKKAELERLNKEKASFLAVAAHELKGPSSIIKLITEDLPKQSPSHQQDLLEQLDIVTHQARKMEIMVNDIRLASQGKANTDLTESVIDIDSFLKREVTELGYIIDQKIILSGSTDVSMATDPDRLSQVVSNLIRNASKYSPGTQEIRVSITSASDSIEVSVQDFGVGISDEDQKHIFEQYYRAPSIADSFQGLGLGLSICKTIIDRMGGKLWVKSELGKGTRFYFSLPIKHTSSE